MGLLDGNLDPQTMAQLQLAGGLLSPGSFGQGLAKGVTGYQTALSNAQDMQLKQQAIQTSIQEQQVRELSMRRAMAQLDEAARWNTPDTPAPVTGAPSLGNIMPPGASGPSAGPQSASPVPTLPGAVSGQPTGLPRGVVGYQGMPLEQLRARINAGIEPKEALDLWKAANVGTPMAPGWRITGNQAPQYLADPNQQFTFGSDNKTVIPQPGSLSAKAQAVTATTTAETRAKNSGTPLPPEVVDRLGPQWAGKSVQDYLDSQQAPAAAPAPASFQGSDALANLPPDQRAAVLRDASRSGLTQFGLTASQNGGQRAAIDLGQPAGLPVTGAPLGTGFKSAADIAADALRQQQQVKIDTQPQLDSATERAKNIQASDKSYSDNLDKKVEEGFNLQRRNAEILAQMSDYRTGISNPEMRAKIASNLVNTFPDSPKIRSVAESINGGSIVSAETLNNLVAGAMVTNALQVLDGQGRLTKSITSQLQAAAESAATDPGALRRIVAIQNKFADQDFAEQQARAKAIKAGDYHPETWQADYSATRRSALDASSSATPLPANPTAAKLSIGTVYTLPNGSTGKWDGFKFRGQ